MFKILLSIFSFFTFFGSISCENILFVSSVISPSHFIYNKALAEGLAAKGHNITFLSGDNEKNPPKNIHYIHLERIYPYFANESSWAENMHGVEDPMDFSGISENALIFMMYEISNIICDAVKLSKGFQQILDYPNDFKIDLVIYDYTFATCLLGLLPKFGYPPLVGISAFSNPVETVAIMGGDRFGLTAKPYINLNYGIDMKIHERLHNAFTFFMDSTARKYVGLPKSDLKTKELFGDSTPFIGDLEKRMVLALVNSNPALDFAESLPPNVIEVAGLQIKEPKPVDKDIDEFLSKGKKGAVLVSFGTNFRCDQFGPRRIEAILDAMRQLPDYNFIWKFETTEMLKNLPPNVMARDWVSQNNILAHPNLKAFVSHAGLLSTQETTWRGIPVVGVPIFVDQYRNLKKSVAAGVAVEVDFKTLTTEALKNGLVEVLENPKYKENMMRRSKLFRDQPQKPIDRAIWWCEYVIRNPNPHHLRQPEFNFGLVGQQLWDVQVLLIFAIFIVFYTVKKILGKLFCRERKIVSREKKRN